MGTDLAVDNVGNVFVAAASNEDNNWDYVTIKYDSMGVEQWVGLYSGPDSLTDIPNSIALDSEGYAYVTGSSDYFTTDYDFATVKYSEVGICEQPQDLELRTHNLKVFPTLSNQHVRILCSVRIPSKIALRLYNLLGRLIESIHDGTVEAGSHEMILNCADLAPGIYFICLRSEHSCSIKKIIAFK